MPQRSTMVLRQICSRQGQQFESRRGPRSLTFLAARCLLDTQASRPTIRAYSTTIESVEQAVQSSLEEIHSIESSVNQESPVNVPSIDDKSDSPPAVAARSARKAVDVKQQYKNILAQRKSTWSSTDAYSTIDAC